MEKLLHDARVRVGALVCSCFLLGSTGWLAWLYGITALSDPSQVDFFTMVLGYVAQAAGIGVYMIVRQGAGKRVSAIVAAVAIVLYVALLEPAVASGSLALTVGFGCAMNVACGIFQGHYLTCIAALVEERGRGVAFGAGYAASTFVTWVLSSVGDGVLTQGAYNVLVCVLLAIIALACTWLCESLPELSGDAGVAQVSGSLSGEGGKPARSKSAAPSLLVLAGLTVVVVSLVKNAGFSFPSADLSGEVNLELSRLFYGVGLIAAGVVADRDRRFMYACCAASLVMPFLMLALVNAAAPSAALWALGYLLFGFFSVFRVILFADLAVDSGRIWLAGAGLALGRVGDAAGTALCLALAGEPVMLIGTCAALFIVTIVLLCLLFARMYGAAPSENEGPDPLEAFGAAHGLSNREQEVLFLIAQGMSNSKMTRELSVSEATVKFHVHNILKKTGCANRKELMTLFRAEFPA